MEDLHRCLLQWLITEKIVTEKHLMCAIGKLLDKGNKVSCVIVFYLRMYKAGSVGLSASNPSGSETIRP